MYFISDKIRSSASSRGVIRTEMELCSNIMDQIDQPADLGVLIQLVFQAFDLETPLPSKDGSDQNI